MIRAFLALPLPEGICAALTVQQFLLPIPRRIAAADFHLTLVFLGEVAEPVLEAAHDSFAALRMPAFDLRLQGLGLFGGAKPNAVWAGVAASDPLLRLQAKAEHAARQAGCPVANRRFTPHVTLGRFSSLPGGDQPRLEQAVAESRLLTEPFAVEEAVLYRSTLTKTGSVYDVLARYPLA